MLHVLLPGNRELKKWRGKSFLLNQKNFDFLQRKGTLKWVLFVK